MLTSVETLTEKKVSAAFFTRDPALPTSILLGSYRVRFQIGLGSSKSLLNNLLEHLYLLLDQVNLP